MTTLIHIHVYTINIWEGKGKCFCSTSWDPVSTYEDITGQDKVYQLYFLGPTKKEDKWKMHTKQKPEIRQTVL